LKTANDYRQVGGFGVNCKQVDLEPVKDKTPASVRHLFGLRHHDA
jgi:hypothetical protein